MDIRKLQRAIVDALEDVKAQDIQVFNTEHLSPLFERVIIASGNSNRQTKALASSVRETVKERGMAVMRTEGEDNGEWIIVDCGAAVAHIMQPAIRQYYRLEEIWGGKPVNMKLGEAKGLPKASSAEGSKPARKTLNAKPATPGKVAKAPKAGATAQTEAGQAALKVKTTAPRKVSTGTKAGTGTSRSRKAEPVTTLVVQAGGRLVKKPAAKAPAKTASKATATKTTKAAIKTTVSKPVVKSAVKAAAKTATKTATKAAAKKAPVKTTTGRKSA